MFEKLAAQNRRRAESERGLFIIIYLIISLLVIGMEEGIQP